MAQQKLFSSEIKAKLAGHTANYKFNRERAKGLTVFSLQAAEAEWNMLDLFLGAAEKVETSEHLAEICDRLQKNLEEPIPLSGGQLDEKKAGLVQWLKKRRAKASATTKRLRKLD